MPIGGVSRWLFLAWLSSVLQRTQKQPCLLAAENRCQPEARFDREPRFAQSRLERIADLATRIEAQERSAVASANSAGDGSSENRAGATLHEL